MDPLTCQFSLGFSFESHIPKWLERVTNSSQQSLAGLRTNKAAKCSCFISVRPAREKKLRLDLISWWRQVLSKMRCRCRNFPDVTPSRGLLRGSLHLHWLQKVSKALSTHQEFAYSAHSLEQSCTLSSGFWGGYDSTWRRYSSVYPTIRNTLQNMSEINPLWKWEGKT